MVISLSNITPTHGSRYYAAESGTEAEQSQWAGKLVPVLEITQPDVEPATFDSLLAGKNPQGQVLVNKMRLAHESVAGSARAGVDLIAATPKSVSIQALVFRDQRLVEAHQQVTRLMLQILEDRYAMTRIRTEGERRKVTTGNLLIAQFTHDSSRALDAHLHTHNVILNLTQRSDRRWASLDNEAIYRSRFLLDKIYQNELARLVQALGYAIHITNIRQGLWELQGFTPQQLQQFSKRSQQIQAVVGTDADYREREWAARYSQRPPKQKTAIEELQQQWQQQAEQLQIAALVPSSASMLRVHTNLHQIIDQAIAYCARRAPQFSREAVETAALSRTMGQYSFSMLTHAIDQSARLTIVNNNKTTLYYQLGDADAVQISARNTSNICTIPAAQTQTTAHWNRAESSTPPLHHSSTSNSPTSDSVGYRFKSLRSNSGRASHPASDSSPPAATEPTSVPLATPPPQPECHLPQAGRVYFRSLRLDESGETAPERTQSNYCSNPSDAGRTRGDQNIAQEVSSPQQTHSEQWQLER